MAIDAKKLSGWDTLRLHLVVTFPAYLWGSVAPNRLGVALLSWLNAGQALPRFFDLLRKNYGSDHLWTRFPMRRTLLVLNPDSMDAVLSSDQAAPDPPIKRRALSTFAPEGLIISSGDEGRDRRRFNERTLDFGRLHRDGDAFTNIVLREVGQLTAKPLGALRWTDFQLLAEKISQQVLLGSGHHEPDMARHLAKMVRCSNVPLRHRRAFLGFYHTLERHLSRHRAAVHGQNIGQASGEPVPAQCLVHRSAELLEGGEATHSTRVPSQIGFWAFVLKDVLELHVARTLALIAAHAEVHDRVRREILSTPTLTSGSIDGLRYLEACVVEQLRLWTPVPILLRRAVQDFSLANGIPIKAQQQILFHAGHYHRDPAVFRENADRFSPGSVDERFPGVFYFSRHQRSCAGQFVARFLLKATLASLLAKFRFELVGPPIDQGRVPYLYNHFKIELRPVHDA